MLRMAMKRNKILRIYNKKLYLIKLNEIEGICLCYTIIDRNEDKSEYLLKKHRRK
jgi:hypothetical protein